MKSIFNPKLLELMLV